MTDKMSGPCQCDAPGYCQRYKRDQIGRLWEICQGKNINAGEAAQYRQLWDAEAAGTSVNTTQVVGAPVDCPFAGNPVMKDGQQATRDCTGCGDGRHLKLFQCTHPAREPEEVTFKDCGACAYKPRNQEGAKAIVFKNFLSPGDVLVMSAAVYSLHRAHPGKFITAVDSSCPAIWEHNPDVVPVSEAMRLGAEVMQTHYPLVNQSNQRAIHFMQAYCAFLEEALGVRVPLMTNRPHVYLSAREKTWMSQVQELGINRPFWLVNAGTKHDFTAKQYSGYQGVVDQLQGKVLFVQVGKTEHLHKPLSGAVNLLGKTDDRQLIRLMWHAQGALCGTTLLHHLAAAFEKPSIVLAGGREPRAWNQYQRSVILSTVGLLPCCREACWKSRVVKLNDGSEQDKSLCEAPALTEPPSPSCMAMFSPEEVVENILRVRA